MMRSIFLLSCLSLFCTIGKAKDYYTFFLGGQSNMEGYGYNKHLPEELQQPMQDVMIFHGNSAADNSSQADGRGIWAPLQAGHGVLFTSDGITNSYSNRFGLELSFAQTMRRLHPDKPIALIKYARGGSSIDSVAASRFGCWEPDFQGETGINQYDHFLATVRAAMAIRDIDGDGEADRLIPVGILWMQGESDGAHGETIALRYASHLKRLMDLIRASFHTDDLPVVIGKISDSGQDEDGKVWDHEELIHQAQEEFVRADKQAAIVRSTKDYQYSDRWHYDSKGYLDLGIRCAEAMDSLIPD